MSSDTPDERISQDPGIPGAKTPSEVPETAEPIEPPAPDGSERPAAPEEPDQEGHRHVR
jgi:hypothetical protein